MIREDDPQFRITTAQQMASACTGALITSLFMTPLDVVKVRLQAQQKALLSNKCYLYCNGLMEHLCPCGEPAWMPKRPHFHGTMDAFYKIAKLEGVPALWSGLSPTLVLALPCTVIYFVTYEQLRCKMKTQYNSWSGDKTQPMWIPLIAGATARTIAVSIVSPLELIRTKMQSQKLSYADLRVAIRQALKVEGVTGLFKGLGSTLLRDVPFSGGVSVYCAPSLGAHVTIDTVSSVCMPPTSNIDEPPAQPRAARAPDASPVLSERARWPSDGAQCTQGGRAAVTALTPPDDEHLMCSKHVDGYDINRPIYWTTFESTKKAFNRTDAEKNTFLFNFMCGSIAGSIAAFITLPFDVVKTHQQIELGEKEIYAAEEKTKQKASAMKDIVRNIYKTHGIKGLFTGFLPRIFKVAPACAIMIATFEYGKQFFQTYNTQKYKEKMHKHQGIVLIPATQRGAGSDYS